MKFLVCLFVVVGCALAIPRQRRDVNDQTAVIKEQNLDISPDGNFKYNYETGNGIQARALGSPKSVAGSQEPAEIIEGSFSWTSPEGKLITVQYTADEAGYRPKVQL
ncbi:larval cuticle protein LCP-17-like [Arctopsyche grandis]|uniref:larval cuticle protein LCP-17-like n=1 Tax=Arctopsyche grandis TaxID=121162 RepID=UPI00406D9BA7